MGVNIVYADQVDKLTDWECRSNWQTSYENYLPIYYTVLESHITLAVTNIPIARMAPIIVQKISVDFRLAGAA